MPAPETLSFEDASLAPDTLSFEDAAPPTSPAGFTPFTGTIPTPAEFDPVTRQKRYLGPWSGGPISPYAPEAMQEAVQTLKAPLSATGALAEGLFGSASEMAVDWLRRTGLDRSARPGVPLATISPDALRIATQATGLPTLEKIAPEFIGGAYEEAARQLTAFTEPGQAATLPFAAAAKPVQALYLGGAVAGLPEAAQRLMEAQTPREFGAALTGGAAQLGMAELMRRGLTREPGADYARKIQEIRQNQEAAKVYGTLRPPPVPGLREVPTPGGGAGTLAQASPEAQVLLRPALENNQRLGIGHQLDVLPDFGAADPGNRRVFQATAPTVDAEGNVTAPGRIRMNAAAFGQWIAFVPEAERAQAVMTALAEEGIHTTVSPKVALAYLKSLTPAEIAAGKKLYLGGLSEAEAGLTDVTLGHELLRQRMQRILRMKPTELAEVGAVEKWSRGTLEAIASAIRSIREFLGTKAARAGGAITDQLLDQYEQRLSEIATRQGMPDPFPERYGGEEPFMVRRGAGELSVRDIEALDEAGASKYFRGLKDKGIGPQYDSVVAGLKLSEKDLPQLQRLHQESGQRMMQALQAGDEKAFQAEFGKNVWYAGAIEGATRKGPNYDRVAQELKDTEIPGLPPQPEGTVRLYHGEGGPGGAGMDAQWFSEDPTRAATYGGQMSYVDIPREVAEYTQRLARKAGSGTSGDHFVPDEWVMRAQAIPGEVSGKIYDLGPAALRRKRPGEQRELFLPPAATGEARPTAAQLGALPPPRPTGPPAITGFEVERGGYAHLQTETDRVLQDWEAAKRDPAAKLTPPSFDNFVKAIRQTYGEKISPGALSDVWKRTVWQRLLNASGAHLEALRQAYNLRAALGDRTIADPPPHRAAFELEQEVRGPAKAQVFEETKGAAARQKYRNNVIAAIGEKMAAEANKQYRLEKKSVTPEDIGFGRRSMRPVLNHITNEERANPDVLASILTDDAREMGMPVSATKRLTVLQNTTDGRVAMVSTYRDPRRGAVLLDPDAPRGTHSRLETILKRWRPVQSILLDEPVKNLKQTYKSLSEFEDQFGQDARELAREATPYELETAHPGELTRGPRGELVAPAGVFTAGEPGFAVRGPVTGPEVEAVFNSLEKEVGVFDTPNDVKELLMSDTLRANRAAVSGLQKLAKELDRKFPDLSLEDLLDKLSNQLYEDHVQSKTFEEFQRRTISQGPPSRGEVAGPGAQAPPAAPETGARELRVPTFARRAVPAPPGPGAEPTLPPPIPPEMLSPADRAYMESRIVPEYEPPKTPEQAASESGAVKDIATDDMPAMINRMARNVAEESKLVTEDLRNFIKRSATTAGITGAADRADKRSNNFSRRQETGIRLQSVSVPGGILKRYLTAWRHGDPETLAAANAVVQAGAVQPNGTIDVAAFMAKLPVFRNLVAQGRTEANNLLQQGGFRKQRLAKAWLRALEDADRELNYAETNINDPRLQKTAARVRLVLDEQYNREVAAGYDLRKDPAYLPQRWDAQLWDGKSFITKMIAGSEKVLGKKFREPAKFETYYHGLAKGPYIPITRDAASLVSHRIRQGEQMMNRDKWMDDLKLIQTPDGRPLAIDPIRLTAQRWGSPTADYEVVGVGGKKPLVIHPDFAGVIDSLVAKNPIQRWAFSRALLNFEQDLKHSLLIGDFFHMGRVTYYAASIMRGVPKWRRAWSVLDIADRDLADAQRVGIVTAKDIAWGQEPVQFGSRTIPRRRLAQLFDTESYLNVGKIQDALYKDLLTKLTPSAGPIRRAFVAAVDPSIGRYNRFLFDKMTRGLMLESAVREFERQQKANPRTSPRKIMNDIARDANNYFGNIGRQGWFKAAWQQDLARMFFLAPQWVEGLLKKEFFGAYPRMIGAAARGVGLAPGYRRGFSAMGTMGRGISTGLGFMFLLTQAVNLISRRQPTFMNEEKGHKLDAWIPAIGGEDEGFWLSPFALFNEITHDLYRLAVDKPKATEAVTQIMGNKFSPLTRAAMVAYTGRSPTGTYLTTSPSHIATAAEQMLPVPITFGRYIRAGGHALFPGTIDPNLPGQLQRQVYSTFGLKVEPSKSALQEAQGLARDFAQEKGRVETVKFEETDQPSYSRLRQAVRNKDEHGAWKMLEKLRSQGKTDDQILKAMDTWNRRNFTWSDDAEMEFWAALSPEQQEVVSRAQYQKIVEHQRFLDYYRDEPH